MRCKNKLFKCLSCILNLQWCEWDDIIGIECFDYWLCIIIIIIAVIQFNTLILDLFWYGWQKVRVYDYWFVWFIHSKTVTNLLSVKVETDTDTNYFWKSITRQLNLSVSTVCQKLKHRDNFWDMKFHMATKNIYRHVNVMQSRRQWRSECKVTAVNKTHTLIIT